MEQTKVNQDELEKQFTEFPPVSEINYNNYATEINSPSYKFKSPLKKLSQNLILLPFNKKIECKTSIDLNYRFKIRKNSQKLLSLSENANENKPHTDQDDSDNDSEISEEIQNAKIQLKKEVIVSSGNYKNDINKLILFEDYYKKFYMPPSENVSGYYDLYVTNCLKMLSIFEPASFFHDKVNEITDNIKPILNLSNKPLLILDLDETLIHSDLECRFEEHHHYLESSGGLIPLNFRPNLFEFLDFCSKHFDLVIYTASCSDYADPILDYLEKDKKYFNNRFYREHCISYHNMFLKDLTIFGKELSKTLIVDNCLFSFSHYLNNGVLITSYYNETDDLDLLSLIEFFKTIIDVEDVRVELENTFEFNKIYNNLVNVHID